MRIAALLTLVAAWPAMALAQSEYKQPSQPAYQPAVPQAPAVAAYGGYPGYYSGGGGTAAGNAMNGMANLASTAGSYNLATSAAAVNMTQAQRNEIENHMEYTKTYFAMREANQAYRKANAERILTPEERIAIAKRGVPKKLETTQHNPETGAIAWPALFRNAPYTEERAKLDQLSAKRAADGELSLDDQMVFLDTGREMVNLLKDQITAMPPSEYTRSKNFLKSLVYHATGTALQ